MPVPQTEAIAEAYACAPSDVVILDTIEMRHSAFVDDNGQPTAIRVVNDHADLTATLEADAPLHPGQAVTFIRFAFEAELPGVENAASVEMKIRLCNVSREISHHCARAKDTTEPVLMTHRAFLSTDTSRPHTKPLTLTVSHVDIDAMTVVCTCGFPNLANRRFPSEFYEARRFPGLLMT